MNALIERLSLLSLFLCVTIHAEAQGQRRPQLPTPGKQSPGSYLPTRFTLSIGGFLSPSYSVELRGESLLYRVRGIDPDTRSIRETSTVVTPSAAEWRRFWRAMDEVDLWRWRSEYANPGVADGTQWGIEIAFAGRRADSSGSNAYPGGLATFPVPSEPDSVLPEASEAFRTYLKAVEELLGGERFR